MNSKDDSTETPISSSIDKAEATINRLGLPRPEKPFDDDSVLEWPNNVAELTPEELAEHLTWWGGWKAYARYHVARAEGNFKALTKKMALLGKMLLFKSKGDYKTITDARAAVAQMPPMVKLAGQEQEAEALVLVLTSLLEGYEDKYNTISREISRREQDWR